MTEKTALEKPQLTQWLPAVTALLALGVAWGAVDTTQEAHARRIDDGTRRMDDHEMRLRNVEQLIPRIDEALKPIARMDDRLRVIERAVKQ